MGVYLLVQKISSDSYYTIYYEKYQSPNRTNLFEKRIKNKEITANYIVKSTGIDQSQISKILNNKAKIRSKNFSVLCKFALNNCYIDPEILKGHTVDYIQNLSATNNKLLLLAVYDIVSSSMDI